MSNVLAAIGRGQLTVIEDRVAKRREHFNFDYSHPKDLPGIGFMPEPEYGRSNRWLTCITVDPLPSGSTADDIRLRLEQDNIEARPIWKPMHLQPAFAGYPTCGGTVSEDIFGRGYACRVDRAFPTTTGCGW